MRYEVWVVTEEEKHAVLNTPKEVTELVERLRQQGKSGHVFDREQRKTVAFRHDERFEF